MTTVMILSCAEEEQPPTSVPETTLVSEDGLSSTDLSGAQDTSRTIDIGARDDGLFLDIGQRADVPSDAVSDATNDGASDAASGTDDGPVGDTTVAPPPTCGNWEFASGAGPGDADFPQGTAAGAIRATRATIWARSELPGQVQVRYSAGPDCPEVVSVSYAATNENDGIVHIPIVNLEPGQLYRYRVERIGGSGWTTPGWLATPPQTADESFTLAFTGDMHQNGTYLELLDDLVTSNAVLLLWLGDWPYADASPSAFSLSEYREKHRAGRTWSLVQEMLRFLPIHANWDDHEVTNDWDGADTASQPARVAAGMTAWKEWFPLSPAVPGEIYRRYPYGPGIDVFQLDCRSHRDANSAPNDAQKTMLGDTQLAWLLQGLSESTAAFKLILTSVPLDYGTTGNDHWPGFLVERTAILQHIVEQKIGGVLFLTADQHWLAVHHLAEGLKEFQTGSLATAPRTPPSDPPPEVLFQVAQRNYGLLDYIPGPPPSLRFTAWGDEGELLYVEEVQSGRGLIEIAPSLETAKWRLGGAHVFTGKGSTTLSWATPGEYTMVWKPTAFGDAAPAPETLVLVDGGTITFSADYAGGGVAPEFSESFTDGSFSPTWVTVNQGQDDATPDWHIEGGVAVESGNAYDLNLGQEVVEKLGTFLWAPSVQFSEGLLSAQIYAGDNDGFGLMYGIQDETTYYRFGVDHQRSFARLVRVDNGVFTVLAENLLFVPPLNEWTSWIVQRDGAVHRVLLEGQTVLTATDATYSSGSIALYSWGMDDVRFDDITTYP